MQRLTRTKLSPDLRISPAAHSLCIHRLPLFFITLAPPPPPLNPLSTPSPPCAAGLSPDILICRSATELEFSTREKLGAFCHVPTENVFSVHDVPNIYHVPLMLNDQGAAGIIMRRLGLHPPISPPQLDSWRRLASNVDTVTQEVRIALVGKYTGLQDSYLSVIKALQHSAVACSRKLVLDWVDAAALEKTAGALPRGGGWGMNFFWIPSLRLRMFASPMFALEVSSFLSLAPPSW